MFLAVKEPETADGLTFAYVRELSEQERNLYKASISVFGNFAAYEFAPQFVRENEAEFFSSMQDCVNEITAFTSPPENNVERYTSLANRRLLNFFSSVRFFSDFVSTKLSRLFGSNSPKVEAFKAELSKTYDSSFAYRFSAKFRNYVQHCGHAVGHLEIRHYMKEGVGAIDLMLTCKTETLLTDYDSWGKLKSELREKELIDLIAITENLSLDIQRLDAFTRALLLESVMKSGADIKEIIKDALGRVGDPVLIDADVSRGLEALKQLPISHVPISKMKDLGIL